jgi:hypothetical protein
VVLTGNITAHFSVREKLSASVALVRAAKLNKNAHTNDRGELPLAGICRAAEGEVVRRLKPEIFFDSSAALCKPANVFIPL